ncbi:hypothetical protein BASA50_004039 [Batrachochytrium salamandrivorans]|uniref:Uncharacterized protein n=1 Tax=Batrachochytrium salamandrivorans TaxID=1357716 RepID=A0ABQ8FH17_9FUNG|nr:hypothetical protein BASA50_004039 [Batrachochytrium salamandrivorans]
MKLISFVAVSFLAITVSAWPHWSLRQFSQAEVEAEIEKLTAAYEEEEASFSPIGIKTRIDRQEVIDTTNRVNSISVRLKETGLNDNDIRELQGKYRVARAEWDNLDHKYNKQYPIYVSARQKRDNAKAVLYLLRGNQDLIVKHNVKYGVQIESSLGSFYNIGLLKQQKDEILKEITILIEELERIKDDEVSPNDGLVGRSDELRSTIRLYEAQCKIAKKIVQKYKRSQPIASLASHHHSMISSTDTPSTKTSLPATFRSKRPPLRRHGVLPTDIFVSRRSSFAALARRALVLLEPSANTNSKHRPCQQTVTLHGLGAAMARAVELALHIQRTASIPISIATTTSSVVLIDDVHHTVQSIKPPIAAAEATTAHMNTTDDTTIDVAMDAPATNALDSVEDLECLDGAGITLEHETRINSAIHIVLRVQDIAS